MYRLLFVLIASLILFTACNDVEKGAENVKRFIPGTYVKEVKNEFTIAYDTLIIQCATGNNFLIVNRTAFQPIRNHKLLPMTYSEVNWKAVYDEPSRNLYEQKLGKTFAFDPANNRLFEGASQYTKVLP